MTHWPPLFDWPAVENRWKASIDDGLRSAVLKITVDTMDGVQGEPDRDTRRRAADRLMDLIRQARKLRSALEVTSPDAIYTWSLINIGLAGEGSANEVSEECDLLDGLKDRLATFELACMCGRTEALDPLAPLAPSEAWSKWTERLLDLMLPDRPLKYGDASRFIGAIWELQKALPRKLRRHGQSLESCDRALRRALGKRIGSRNLTVRRSS